MKLFVDSSAFAKRYVFEDGSEIVDDLFSLSICGYFAMPVRKSQDFFSRTGSKDNRWGVQKGARPSVRHCLLVVVLKFQRIDISLEISYHNAIDQ
ncbi:MAG: hypothetical protein JRI36_02710 [Deltaproteobacteria bacterium]|nr:hypothetical protein [Deltaproteobacteria bacterium]